MRLFKKWKPRIPPISDTEGVIDWFLRYDDKIADLRRRFPVALNAVKTEIMNDLAAHAGGQALKRHLEWVDKIWRHHLQESTKRYEAGGPLAGELPEEASAFFYNEAVYAAESRILGYFLLRRYGIQPEPPEAS